MKYFMLILMVLYGTAPAFGGGETVSRYHEDDLLMMLSSADLSEMEKAFVYIRRESIKSHQIVRALVELLDDPRPERRVSRDVIGRSPSKSAYYVLEHVLGFKPSQPSLLFEESKKELKGFIVGRYPELWSDESEQSVPSNDVTFEVLEHKPFSTTPIKLITIPETTQISKVDEHDETIKSSIFKVTEKTKEVPSLKSSKRHLWFIALGLLMLIFIFIKKNTGQP